MTVVIVCTTCRQPHLRENKERKPCGETLFDECQAQLGQDNDVSVIPAACLMGCEHGCNIALREKGKMSYVLGRFEPNTDSAQAILDYARLHQQSEKGVVAYKSWPQGVKGHFIARIPPED